MWLRPECLGQVVILCRGNVVAFLGCNCFFEPHCDTTWTNLIYLFVVHYVG